MKRSLVLAACLFAASPAFAETRIFVVDNTDGYEIDRCLASGEPCGAAAATIICQSRQFDKALGYGPVEAAEVTGTLQHKVAATSASNIVAVTCSR